MFCREGYWKWLLDHWKTALIFFGILYLFITQAALVYSDSPVTGFKSSVYCGLVMSVMIAYGLPLFEFNFVHTRKGADVYFALPVSRKRMLAENVFFAVTTSVGYFAFSTLVSYFVTVLQGSDEVRLSAVLLLCVYMLLFITTLVCFNSMLFLLGNNTVDGLIILAAYSFLPLLAVGVTDSYTRAMLPDTAGFVDSPVQELLSPFLTGIFDINAMVDCLDGEIGITGAAWYRPVILLLYLVLSVYGLYKQFICRKSERAEHVSDGFFSYPLVISVYTAAAVLMIVLSGTGGSRGRSAVWTAIWSAVVFALYVIATFIYRRKIRITVRSILFFAVTLACCFLFSGVSFKTHSYGFGDRLPELNSPYLAVRYITTVRQNDLGVPSSENDGTAAGRTVNVNLNITVKTSSLDEYPELRENLLAVWKQGIEDFYSRDYDLGGTTLILYKEQDGSGYFGENSCQIQSRAYLSEENLKTLDSLSKGANDYFDIYDENYENSLTLEEFLKERDAAGDHVN